LTNDTLLDEGSHIYKIDASNNNITLTLMDIFEIDGPNFEIIRIDTNSNNTIIINPFNGSQTINGQTSLNLPLKGNIRINALNSNWEIIFQNNIGFLAFQGSTGFVGSTGFIGETGLMGLQGLTGLQGLIGMTGSTGFKGSTGFQGTTGFVGQTGFQGITGFIGSTGVIGLMGSTGLIGSTGFIGVTGFLGSTGFQGSTGLIGFTGFVGSTGSQGVTGFIGSTGIFGQTGFVGSTGLIGSTGFQGTTGLIGSTGPQGRIGSMVTINDTKSTGTNGGTFTLGAWRVRDLNTISSSFGPTFATLNTNIFTLDPGTYYLTGTVPARGVNSHKASVVDNVSGVVLFYGTSAYSLNATTATSTTTSNLSGIFTINNSTTFRIDHRSTATRTTDGFGASTGIGVPEIYTCIDITKLA
jgi:hypothetical protein